MFHFDPNKTYRMPPFFGGMDFDPNFESRVEDVLSLIYTVTTDGKKLADYLPEGFELLRPEYRILYNQLRSVDFMFGGGYNLIQIDLPVRYKGKRDCLEGVFPLVIWENSTKPIIGGREESGQPKIYADIQDLRILNNVCFTNASYDGNTFLKLELNDPKAVNRQMFEQIRAGSANINVFGWRYIPNVGAPGAALSQPVLYPQSMQPKCACIGTGSFKWLELDKNYKYDEPINYYEIIKQLAALPVINLNPVLLLRGKSLMKGFSGRVLE